MAYRLKKTIVLVGMMGAGKSAIGTAMARKLDVPYRDSDTEIEMAADRAIAEIFERDGEAFFRDREAEVIGRLLDGSPAILSTGGGAFLAERNRAAIHARGLSVWLKADLDLLWNRVRHKTTRPLLRTADPLARLAELCAAREPLYALADLTVEAHASYSIPQMAERVLAAVLAQGPAIIEEIET